MHKFVQIDTDRLCNASWVTGSTETTPKWRPPWMTVSYGRRHFTWARGAHSGEQADLPQCNLLGQYTRSRKTTDAVARVVGGWVTGNGNEYKGKVASMSWKLFENISMFLLNIRSVSCHVVCGLFSGLRSQHSV